MIRRIQDAAAQMQDLTGFSGDALANILLTVLVLIALSVIRGVLLRVVRRQVVDVKSQYTWRKAISYTTIVIGFLLVGRIWVEAFGALATFLGLLSAGVVIALRDLLMDIAGWLFIVWRRPLAPGDRISLSGFTGDIIDQRLFHFTILETGTGQSTGRIIHIPNGKVFSEAVINYTRGFSYIWNEVDVVLTFDSDWRKAKEILNQVASEYAEYRSHDAEDHIQRAAQEYMIFYSKLTPVVYTDVVEHGVRLALRYLVKPRERRDSVEEIWEAVLERFARHDDVTFAYPRQRIFYTPDADGQVGRTSPDLDPREGSRE